MQRIGVFVCHCGTNIAGTVDVKAVAEALKNEPGVVFSTDYQYMCSQAGQDLIKNAIAEHKLTGVVVCSCSPAYARSYVPQDGSRGGTEFLYVRDCQTSVSNAPGFIRRCRWVQEKAIILGKAAVAKVDLNAPLTPGESPVTKRALVIGGWYRGNTDRAGYCGCRLPGGYCGNQAYHRRENGTAG